MIKKGENTMLIVDFKRPVGSYTYKYHGLSIECTFYDSSVLLSGATAARELNIVIFNMEHLLNCSDLLPQMITNVKINTAWADAIDVALALAKMGIEVSLYYKELQ